MRLAKANQHQGCCSEQTVYTRDTHLCSSDGLLKADIRAIRLTIQAQRHFAHETLSVDNVIVRVLKIVGELVSRLIYLDVIRPWHDHHDDAAVLELLDRTSELRSFRPELPTVASMSSHINAIEW